MCAQAEQPGKPSKPMTFWGMGPRIFAPAILVAVAAGIITRLYPDYLLLHFLPVLAFRVIGGVMIAAGLALSIRATHAMQLAVRQNRLETSGPFALCRNPMYLAWILLIIPGIVICSRAWLVFLCPLTALLCFLFFIPREEVGLQERFGQEYLDYKSRVPLLLPRLARPFNRAANGSPDNTRSKP